MNGNLREYTVWDRSTRLFHWINALSVIGLIGIGLVIYNGKALGVSGDGKVLLKTLHTYIGYVFALNLAWRIAWGFTGNRYARWRAVLPLGGGFTAALRGYVNGLKRGSPPTYLGHNPMARIMIGLMFLLLGAQAVTGLVLAGTDLYMPPFGGSIAEWIAESPDKAAMLKPGAKDFVNPESYAAMREFRKPFIELHELLFFAMLLVIALHVAAVIQMEIRERSGLISAMFTGHKVFGSKPVDAQE